jgi:hypothetical protein
MAGPLSFEYQAGDEIQAGDKTLLPFVKVWRLQFPGRSGGFVWSRPASLLARSPDGQEQLIPIPDLTRRVIGSLFGACLGAIILVWLITRINRKSQ